MVWVHVGAAVTAGDAVATCSSRGNADLKIREYNGKEMVDDGTTHACADSTARMKPMMVERILISSNATDGSTKTEGYHVRTASEDI